MAQTFKITIALRTGSIPEIRAALHGLALLSLAQIRAGAVTRPLYASGVKYMREPLGRERWQSARETQQYGYGDCEDLTAWRVAELWAQGEAGAEPYVYEPRPGLAHCQVKRANGKIEDPSRLLGMGPKHG